MAKLVAQINKLRKTALKQRIDSRLKEFESFKFKDDADWFCELSFCLLTANSKARTALAIQAELGKDGFLKAKESQVRDCIRRNKHRFHNNKAKYIVAARKHKDIKKVMASQSDPRAWLVENIKGLGWKESSHFLRNVGYKDYAIIDRHVINILREHGYLNERPKTLSKNKYHEIESSLKKICDNLKISQAELDMYLWYMKTGEVLK
jgi:N-glycosylase/DNA lyase